MTLARIKANRPDLLITDIMMPEMDGTELLALVRGDPALADLPVITLVFWPPHLRRNDYTGRELWRSEVNTDRDGALVRYFSAHAITDAVERLLTAL